MADCSGWLVMRWIYKPHGRLRGPLAQPSGYPFNDAYRDQQQSVRDKAVFNEESTSMLKRLLLAAGLTLSLSLGATAVHGPLQARADNCSDSTGSLSHHYGYTDGRGNVRYEEDASATNNAPAGQGYTIEWHDNTGGNSWYGSQFGAPPYGGGGGVADQQWLQLGHSYTVYLVAGSGGAVCHLATDTFSA